jgi:hypothetical protein
MEDGKVILYMDGGLASQMTAYVFYKQIEKLGYKPELDLTWFDRFGRDRYLLNEVFQIKASECNDLGRYKIYNSGNLFAKAFRKSKLINLAILVGVVPKIHYSVKPRYLGHVFDLDAVDEVIKRAGTTYLWGYWGFTRFIEEAPDEMRVVFQFPKIADYRNSKVLEEITSCNSVSLHVRKGDYLKYPDTFENLSLSYYRRAIHEVKNRTSHLVFYIFSNDIEWCKKNTIELGLENEEVVFVSGNEGSDAYIDMNLMSHCCHNICANSGFSLWAAFLNDNQHKTVVVPKRFYTDYWCKKNRIDLYRIPEKEWIVIDN